jgi:hypothetical protein
MKIEEVRNAKNQRPFEPFLLRMADGREIEIRHPDAMAWDGDQPRILHCVMPGGGWVKVDLALVTSLAEAPARSAPKKRRKG